MRSAPFAKLRVLAVSLVIVLLSCAATTHSYASTVGHPCAPPVPPPVAGSPVSPPATPGIVLINEVLTNPGSTWNCSENGTYSLMSDSWVELYDPQSQPFNLYAVHAGIDSGPGTFTFHFPFGAAIAPHGFLVVFPDTYSGTLAAGNNLRLVFAGTMIDQVSLPALATDYSYARIPDGSPNWQITNNPTIDASNMASTQATPTTPPSSGSGGSGYGYSTTTPTLVNGTQPAWKTLQLPQSTAASTAVANAPLLKSPSSPSASAPGDLLRRILLTVLLIALASSLFWCWKLFSSR